MMRRMPAIIAWLVLFVCIGTVGVAHAMLVLSVGKTVQQGSWVEAISFLAFPTVGALIISQRPKNTVGWIFCAIGLGTAATSFIAGYVQHALAVHADTQLATGLIDVVGNVVWTLNLGLGSLLLFLFPDGKLPSHRWRPVFWLDVACIAAVSAANGLQPGPLEANRRVINPIGITSAATLLASVIAIGQALFVLLVLAAIASVIVRYRRAEGIQRQQIKWFAYGTALMALIFVATVFLASALTPSGQDPSSSLISTLGFSLGFLMLPIGAGIGVLRYRLYDIDILINRTLVYGSLTAVLAAVYFGVVIGLQSLTTAITGQTNTPPVIIVASTLLIAALFNPLRRRLQTAIDHRFYRRKYDATRTLETFAATLRSEVELSALQTHLTDVVEHTMQPTHISLWLRTRGREARP